MKDKYLIFDLDDTLFYEIDYLKSAYKEIAAKLNKQHCESLLQQMLEFYFDGTNVFKFLAGKYPQTNLDELLKWYRGHIPDIHLNPGANELLTHSHEMGCKLGMITDGHSVTQRNKLKALGLEGVFDRIVISEEFGSEKPNEKNYWVFIQKDIENYVYIGDNTEKDFVTPNKLGWASICLLDKGQNIHQQNFELPQKYLPQYTIESLSEVNLCLR
jgi:putative hydrolase of the HAD superfamily